MTGDQLITWLDTHTDIVLTDGQREYLHKRMDKLDVRLVDGVLEIRLTPVMFLGPGGGK